MGKRVPIKWDFRDVSSGIQKLRNFLLGRKYVLHNRFPPLIAPRSIPPPDIPRGPEYKYSDQWYGKRDVLNSVKPPVVAPIAEGLPSRKPKDNKPAKVKCDLKAMDIQEISFPCPPTPGPTWWFDGHCYYKEVYASPRVPPSPTPPPPCAAPPPSEKPCPVLKADPCDEPPPCKLQPCQVEKVEPPPPPSVPCDPCESPKKKC